MDMTLEKGVSRSVDKAILTMSLVLLLLCGSIPSLLLPGTRADAIVTVEGNAEMAIDFKDEEFTINAPQYTLPLSSIPSNIRTLNGPLTSEQEDELAEHGFVNAGRSDFFDPFVVYNEMYN